MKIPEFKTSRKLPIFKRSKVFLDGIQLPCLLARLRNSKMPGIARRHIAKYKNDPVCSIYLRSADDYAISGWQKTILDELFTNEKLPAVIETAMKQFENEPWPGFDQIDKRNYNQIKKYGIAPHLTLSSIVLDDVKREAIISGSTEWDDNLHEHGISFHLTPRGWRFEYDDYLFGYWSELEREVSEKRLARELPDDESKRAEKDTTFLFGDWKFDEKEALLHYKQLKWRTSKIRDALGTFCGRRVMFSEQELRVFDNTGGEQRYEVVKYERQGNVATIHLRTIRTKMSFSCKYRLRDGFLIDSDGEVLRKV